MKKLEDEVQQDFHIYFIAHQLGKDIDEVESWDHEKLLKWTIYFKILAEEQVKAFEVSVPRIEKRNGVTFVFRKKH